MHLKPFDGQTAVIAENQPQYLPMPAHISPTGDVTCCWQLTWRERLQLLFTGEIWHQIRTFSRPLQPQRLSTKRPEGMES
jgi:hypothetical protein